MVLVGRPDLQAQVLQSTVSQFPLIGEQLKEPQQLSGGTVAVDPEVRDLLTRQVGVFEDLGCVVEQASPDFPEAAAAQVRDWQGAVLDLVRSEGADKRSQARVLSWGVNGAGAAVMVSCPGGFTLIIRLRRSGESREPDCSCGVESLGCRNR